MKHLVCGACGTRAPLAEGYEVRGETWCKPCTAARLRELDPDEVHTLVDPTLCADCRADNGESPHALLHGRPVCGECRAHRGGLRFPLWTRLACGGVIVLAPWAALRSVRMVRAHRAWRAGVQAFQANRYRLASECLAQAAAILPDEEAYLDLAAYYRGYRELSQGNPAGAVACFQDSLKYNPESHSTREMLIWSQRRAAFEARDYLGYFRASQDFMALEEESPEALVAMSSAWACRYVRTGREEDRRQALDCLERARKAGYEDKAYLERVEAWVKHMMETRTIEPIDTFGRDGGQGILPDQDVS